MTTTTPLRYLAALVCLWFALTAPVRAEPQVGDAVPGFDTVLLDGKTFSAADLKGKPVLVMFWATWCPICRKEMPGLQKLFAEYRARGFVILALSIDAERIEVEEFWKDYDYDFPVAMRVQRHNEIFGVTRATPRFFLIDRGGVLRFAHRGAVPMDTLEARLKPLL